MTTMNHHDRITLIQRYDVLIEQASQVGQGLHALQRKDNPLSQQDRVHMRMAYLAWYRDCLAVLPDDLARDFREQYETTPLKKRLQTYLDHAHEELSPEEQETQPRHSRPWKYPFFGSFSNNFSAQQTLLRQAHQKQLEGISTLAPNFRLLIASIFGGRHHSMLTVDSVFKSAGAQPSWKLKSFRWINGKKVSHVLAWLDGIALYAPEREYEIVSTVCSIIINQGMTNSKTAKQMEEYLRKIDTPTPPQNVVSASPNQGACIDSQRLDELRTLAYTDFDVSRLIRMCEELNACMEAEYYFAVAMLTRAILDHVPPIFGAGSFAEIANNYTGTKSFKDSMQHLNGSMRKISDAALHTQIRRSEVLPTRRQVEVGNDLDVLLGEVIRLLKKP